MDGQGGPSLAGLTVLVRGAGEMASAVVHRLARAGFHVVMTETPGPLAVRRAVSFCEAVYEGVKTVEGLTARLIDSPAEAEALWAAGELPLLVDPGLACLAELRPLVIVDATLAKADTGLRTHMAPLTIGLGPGFSAPEMVHLVIETNRGHDLGRLIYEGRAAANTGVPGDIAGHTHARVLRAPAQGVFSSDHHLGDVVQAGETVGLVGYAPVVSALPGILRGLIRPGTRVQAGLKLGDVDPRGRSEYLATISDKARAIAGSVLEGIMARFNRAGSQ
jgi:xanthine dehydrogenase accessory factor